MYKVLSAVLILALASIAPALPTDAANATPTPAPSERGTPPPVIYHVITRPLCTELHKHIAPAIGMMLQNDATIKKSPKLFKRYNLDALSGVDNSVSNAADEQGGSMSAGGASGSTMTAAQNMAILGMENLVSPIANNIIATQTMLDDPALANGTGNAQDDQRLQDIRVKLLKALADQNAALDIVNGFVQTQQMADLQHVGQEYVGVISKPDTKNTGATPSPDPMMQNANQAGLPPNPYAVDLAAIPGLTLGYNPVTRLLEGLNWTIAQTATHENEAAKAVMASAALCSASTPAP